jgi:hypothetical protein
MKYAAFTGPDGSSNGEAIKKPPHVSEAVSISSLCWVGRAGFEPMTK